MRPPGILVREVDDELLVLDTVRDRIHHLNGSAAAIWRLHAEGLRAEEIAGELAAHFEVSLETAVADARDVVGRLRSLGLVD